MTKNIEPTKNTQSEMKGALTKMKNNLQRTNSRVDEAKNQVSDWEYNKAKIYTIRTAKTNKKEF